MNYLDEKPILRVLSITASFLLGLVLVYTGWKQTGELAGLIQMLIGVVALLLALAIYNHPYRDRRK